MGTRDGFLIIMIPVRNRHRFKSGVFRGLERWYQITKRISVFLRMKTISESIAAEYYCPRSSYSPRLILTLVSMTLLCLVDSRAVSSSFLFNIIEHGGPKKVSSYLIDTQQKYQP
jgi:hypothetical protein